MYVQQLRSFNWDSSILTTRFAQDTCPRYYQVELPKEPPIPLSNIAIVSNGNCASTCSHFSTVMFERHQVKVAVFGGKPGEPMEYKGMAGAQVLEWSDLSSEIKTANLENDPLAPPDLLVSGNMRVNWRTAWSYFDEPFSFLAYQSEPAICTSFS